MKSEENAQRKRYVSEYIPGKHSIEMDLRGVRLGPQYFECVDPPHSNVADQQERHKLPSRFHPLLVQLVRKPPESVEYEHCLHRGLKHGHDAGHDDQSATYAAVAHSSGDNTEQAEDIHSSQGYEHKRLVEVVCSVVTIPQLMHSHKRDDNSNGRHGVYDGLGQMLQHNGRSAVARVSREHEEDYHGNHGAYYDEYAKEQTATGTGTVHAHPLVFRPSFARAFLYFLIYVLPVSNVAPHHVENTWKDIKTDEAGT